MSSRSLIAAFAAIIVLLAGAPEASGFTVLGKGHQACGNVISAKKNNDDVQAGRTFKLIGWAQIEAYTQGFLTGINAVNGGNVMKNRSLDEAVRWVERYCKKNLEDTLIDALSTFVARITAKKPK